MRFLREDFTDGVWKLVASKDVPDSDGFTTDYSWYTDGNKHIFIFGDSDLYTPEDTEPDIEFETEKEAEEWFNSYKGLIEEELEDSDLETYPDGEPAVEKEPIETDLSQDAEKGLADLIIDEKEAIEGYSNTIDELSAKGELTDKAEEVLKHIEEEELEHVEELSKVVAGDENEIVTESFEDVDVPAPGKEVKKCCICGQEIKGYGNNARPVKNGSCCDECNLKVVIPARLKSWSGDETNESLEDDDYVTFWAGKQIPVSEIKASVKSSIERNKANANWNLTKEDERQMFFDDAAYDLLEMYDDLSYEEALDLVNKYFDEVKESKI